MSQPTIALIEDDENDVFFFKRAARAASIANPMQIIRDGREAIDYINGTGAFLDREQYPLPVLIVLDLNLPHRNGLDILRHLRSRPETQTTIVVVLTSSTSSQDMHEAYAFGANSYLAKPANPDQLAEHLRLIKAYWLTLNLAPPRAGYETFPAPGGSPGP
jgi:CheY-like chemotaxis protein